jgi:hypothetical protein
MNEFNMTANDTYVVLKLVTGEQIMAVKRAESNNSITIEFPMLIKSYPFMNNGEMSEHVTASPYCKFSEDKIFEFRKTDIVFEKKVHKYAIPFYVKLVNEYEGIIEGEENDNETIEDLSKKVDRLLDHLKSIAKEQEPEVKINVDGNDTLH